LKAAGVSYSFHRYHAQHAFGNETNVNRPIPVKYDPSAAETAWQRTLTFFGQHLGAPQHA
jgi:carboxymethylenebutenolidase